MDGWITSERSIKSAPLSGDWLNQSAHGSLARYRAHLLPALPAHSRFGTGRDGTSDERLVSPPSLRLLCALPPNTGSCSPRAMPRALSHCGPVLHRCCRHNCDCGLSAPREKGISIESDSHKSATQKREKTCDLSKKPSRADEKVNGKYF